MKKGISLHLGLNYVDPKHYDGWDGELFACEADAKDMTALANSRGFKSQTLLRQKVTAKAVKEAILKAAKSLKSGDTFLLTYSGHGGQVPDTNADEGNFGDTDDRKDETWCLFDRELVDDELAALYAQFKPGVRILVLSDSCHSGTVTRRIVRTPRARVRLLPPGKAAEVYRKNQALYEAIQRGVTGAEQQEIKATVLLISGCQDKQLSRDGDLNGAFTGMLKQVWNDGAFEGNYKHFRDQIAAGMAEDQIPNYFVTGAANKSFENEQPFTVYKAKRGGKPIGSKRPKRAAKVKVKAGTPLEVVIAVLDHYGFGGAQPDSPLTKWFQRLAKEDEAAAVPGPGRVALIAATLNERLGVGLDPDELIDGDYPTPQRIANLA